MTDMASPRSVSRLSEQLAAGEHDALHECYQRWGPLVHTIAMRALGNRHDAEDVTQQVFVSAWQSRASLRPSESALPAWLIGITRRRVADELARRVRDRARSQAARSDLATQDAPPLEHVVDAVVLRRAVDQMPEPRRTVFILAYVHDKTQEEISAALALPLGTVKSHLRRGLLHLRTQLREVSDGPRS